MTKNPGFLTAKGAKVAKAGREEGLSNDLSGVVVLFSPGLGEGAWPGVVARTIFR
jgi:hypothetical protein